MAAQDIGLFYLFNKCACLNVNDFVLGGIGTELDLNGDCEAWNKCFCKIACGAVKLAL